MSKNFRASSLFAVQSEGERKLSDIDDDKKPEASSSFDPKEMDKIIRQIVDKVRGNYFLNGPTGRGIPAEVKKIIEQSVERM